jgi:hypothetical protein
LPRFYEAISASNKGDFYFFVKIAGKSLLSKSDHDDAQANAKGREKALML